MVCSFAGCYSLAESEQCRRRLALGHQLADSQISAPQFVRKRVCERVADAILWKTYQFRESCCGECQTMIATSGCASPSAGPSIYIFRNTMESGVEKLSHAPVRHIIPTPHSRLRCTHTPHVLHRQCAHRSPTGFCFHYRRCCRSCGCRGSELNYG